MIAQIQISGGVPSTAPSVAAADPGAAKGFAALMRGQGGDAGQFPASAPGNAPATGQSEAQAQELPDGGEAIDTESAEGLLALLDRTISALHQETGQVTPKRVLGAFADALGVPAAEQVGTLAPVAQLEDPELVTSLQGKINGALRIASGAGQLSVASASVPAVGRGAQPPAEGGRGSASGAQIHSTAQSEIALTQRASAETFPQVGETSPAAAAPSSATAGQTNKQVEAWAASAGQGAGLDNPAAGASSVSARATPPAGVTSPVAPTPAADATSTAPAKPPFDQSGIKAPPVRGGAEPSSTEPGLAPSSSSPAVQRVVTAALASEGATATSADPSLPTATPHEQPQSASPSGKGQAGTPAQAPQGQTASSAPTASTLPPLTAFARVEATPADARPADATGPGTPGRADAIPASATSPLALGAQPAEQAGDPRTRAIKSVMFGGKPGESALASSGAVETLPREAAALAAPQLPGAEAPRLQPPSPLPAAPPNPASQPEEQLRQHVAQHIRGLETADNKLRFALSPYGMGEIEIEVVRLESGRMQIAMTTESAAVLNILRQDREQLLDALQSRGLDADSADLDFQTFDDRSRGGGRERFAPTTGTTQGAASPEDPAKDDIPAPRMSSGPGSLDILT